MLLADAALALSARSLAQARARVLGELISGTASVAMRGCFPIRQTFPVNTIWSARQGDPDQHFSPLRLPSASPPKRRWRFASPNANSMPQASSASAQRGEDEKEQVRQRRDKPTLPPGRSERTVFRRDHKEIPAVERYLLYALWDQRQSSIIMCQWTSVAPSDEDKPPPCPGI